MNARHRHPAPAFFALSTGAVILGLSLWGLYDQNPDTMQEAARLWLFVAAGTALWIGAHIMLGWRTVNAVISTVLSLLPLAGLIALLLLVKRSLSADLEAYASQAAKMRRPLTAQRALY